jgi:hypothetical protein
LQAERFIVGARRVGHELTHLRELNLVEQLAHLKLIGAMPRSIEPPQLVGRIQLQRVKSFAV